MTRRGFSGSEATYWRSLLARNGSGRLRGRGRFGRVVETDLRQLAAALVVDAAMSRHFAQPELHVVLGLHGRQIRVQLKEHILREFLGGGAIGQKMQRDAEDRGLMAAHDLGEVRRGDVVQSERSPKLSRNRPGIAPRRCVGPWARSLAASLIYTRAGRRKYAESSDWVLRRRRARGAPRAVNRFLPHGQIWPRGLLTSVSRFLAAEKRFTGAKSPYSAWRFSRRWKRRSSTVVHGSPSL